MKKKLITLLALVALVSSFAMAVENVYDPANTPAEVDSISLATSAPATESATVVADAPSLPFIFELQANPGDSTWVPAAGKEVYDATWNVRNTFVANFRILAKEGTQHTATSFSISIEAGQLKHISDPNVTAGTATITGAIPNGANFGGSFASDTFNLTTATNHTYTGAADDAVTFNVTYSAAPTAPAGRYKSNVKVTYTVS